MNFFKILGLKEEFTIDLEMLESHYIELQKKFHPDSAKEFDISDIYNINEAYRVLKQDYSRAALLLNYKFGIDLSDEIITREYLDSNILSEIMEEMEFIENISDIEILENVKNRIINNKSTVIEEISNLFKSDNLSNLATKIIHLKYYEKLIETINNKIEECY